MSFIKLWVTLFTAIPTVFFVISVCLIWSQTQKIDTYLPTHAEVRAAHIDKRVNRLSEGQTSVTYAPIVEYKYQVDNRWHVSKTVLPAATCLPAMIAATLSPSSTRLNVRKHITTPCSFEVIVSHRSPK